jgi:hypothetical protein
MAIKQLDQVEEIEPWYSAWKSLDFRDVFKGRSDIFSFPDGGDCYGLSL